MRQIKEVSLTAFKQNSALRACYLRLIYSFQICYKCESVCQWTSNNREALTLKRRIPLSAAVLSHAYKRAVALQLGDAVPRARAYYHGVLRILTRRSRG